MSKQPGSMTKPHDDQAEAFGWYGPQAAFGLMYEFIRPGQSVLDIGIGTGIGAVLFSKAGLTVHGMDYNPEMLDVCRDLDFSDLKLHNLTAVPYPYGSQSIDHAVCVGVLNFYRDLTPVFQETSRILRKGGLFAFTVCDRSEQDAAESVAVPERSDAGEPVIVYRHSASQIHGWAHRFGFELRRSLWFTAFMCRGNRSRLQAKAYLVQKDDETV